MLVDQLTAELKQYADFKVEMEKISTEVTKLRECKVEVEKLKNKNKSGFYPHRVVKTVVLKYLNGSVMKTNIFCSENWKEKMALDPESA